MGCLLQNHEIMKALFAALLVLPLVGCASDPIEDRGERDDADLLAEQADAKADGFSACGDACGAALCGVEWEPGNSSGAAACQSENSDAATRLAFEMTGTDSARIDTRTIPSTPVMRLDRVYMYGCDIWNFGTRSGFELLFRDITKGAFLVNDVYDKGLAITLYTKSFTGAGEYTAELGVAMSSVRTVIGAESVSGNRYYTPNGCTLKVQENSGQEGGFSGSFDCPNVPSQEGNGAIRFTGTFLIPATAVDQTMIVAKPVL